MKGTKVVLGIVLALTLSLAGCDDGTVTSSTQPGTQNNASIVCFGDSLTEGHGASSPGLVDKSKSYPAFLQQKVTPPVVNAGISGDTAADGLARVDKDVLPQNPQMVIILLGANDSFRLRPANATKTDLQDIINKIRSGNRKIYLASFIGSFDIKAAIVKLNPQISGLSVFLEEYKKEYENMFSDLIEENKDIGFIPDIWKGVSPEIHMADEIHPNAEGYRIMAENIFSVTKPYLEENNLVKK